MDTAPAAPLSRLEQLTREIGGELLLKASGATPALFESRSLRGALLARALADEPLRRAIFQFIDVLPQLQDAASIARHFRAYLGGHELGGLWGRLLKLGNHTAAAWAVRGTVARTARQFLIEEKPDALARVLSELAGYDAHATLDAVGEAVLTRQEADAYAARYRELLRWQIDAGVAHPHVSIKLSALTPRFDPLDPDGTSRRVMKRLQPLIAEFAAARAAVTLDMEQSEYKYLIINIFFKMLEIEPRTGWMPGIALQAYCPDTERDIKELARHAKAAARRIGVRLVKGAYWDYEVALAAQRHWPAPVYLDKARTDANFERLTRLLFARRDVFHPAIAGHNPRSLAHAIAAARLEGVSPDEWEIQMLYGMADPLARAVASLGVRLRMYVPAGDLVTGIAYLIRRLLENTANTSVLRQTYAAHADPGVLLAAPAPHPQAAPAPHPQAAPARPAFANSPLLDFSTAGARAAFAQSLANVRRSFGRTYALEVSGSGTSAGALQAAINPANPHEVLGLVELATPATAAQAVANAHAAFAHWRDTPVERRIELLLRAAGLMFERRTELAAWEVFEQGKSRREADADVAEAIDHLRYYAARMAAMAGWRATRDFPGETNATRYEPCGVAAVIAPWNFPLAILAGMTAAALVTGNCAIMKPAAPAGIVAHQFHSLLMEAGIPPGVCLLLPGTGAEIGDALVRHPQVHIIAFTGSRETGLAIIERAAHAARGQAHVKRVICEMGGKNAIIVDDDADLDAAIEPILHSAFGYQGQKCSACSRLIAVGDIHDRLVARLADALDCQPMGPPEDPQFVYGPLISEAALLKAQSYLEIGRGEGR